MGSFAQGGSTGSNRSNSIAKRDADRTSYAAKQQARRNTRNAKGGKHGYGVRTSERGYGA